MELRPYQLAAIEDTSAAIRRGISKPLIVAPTASGKSVICAGILKRYISLRPESRALCLTMQSEILEQNERALLTVAPEANTGIYCAGSGRKDKDAQVVFASRDSLGHSDPLVCGNFELVLIDEAHMVSSKAGTRYQNILAALNPKWVVGFTGTPWRLEGGNIWGEGGYFDAITYNISLDFLVGQGFLCPYIYPDIKSVISTEGVEVSKSNNDFKTAALEEVSSSDQIVEESVSLWESESEGRKTSLFFCCSRAHARKVHKELKRRGYKTAYLDGETKRQDRDDIIANAKTGSFDCIVNVNCLTTGVDIPIIDCIVMLRATKSATLFVQSIGRGLRNFEGKENCLILDMTDNCERFGTIDSPNIVIEPEKLEKPRECFSCKTVNDPRDKLCTGCGKPFPKTLGENPKACKSCKTLNHSAAKVCSYCGELFLNHKLAFHRQTNDTHGWFEVKSYYWKKSKTKAGDPCYIVTYTLKDSGKKVRQWLMYERIGWHGKVAKEFSSVLEKHRVTEIKVSSRRTLKEKYPGIEALKHDKNLAPVPLKKEGNLYATP